MCWKKDLFGCFVSSHVWYADSIKKDEEYEQRLSPMNKSRLVVGKSKRNVADDSSIRNYKIETDGKASVPLFINCTCIHQHSRSARNLTYSKIRNLRISMLHSFTKSHGAEYMNKNSFIAFSISTSTNTIKFCCFLLLYTFYILQWIIVPLCSDPVYNPSSMYMFDCVCWVMCSSRVYDTFKFTVDWERPTTVYNLYMSMSRVARLSPIPNN